MIKRMIQAACFAAMVLPLPLFFVAMSVWGRAIHAKDPNLPMACGVLAVMITSLMAAWGTSTKANEFFKTD